MKPTKTANSGNIIPFSSTTSKKSKAKYPAIYQLRRYFKGGRLFIVDEGQILKTNPTRLKLRQNKIIKVTRANSWLDAKVQFGFEMTEFQALMLAEDFLKAA